MGLVADVMSGSTRALARLATHIENDDAVAAEAMDRLYLESGRANTIGVTGPPGSGKSTLVNAFVKELRSLGRTCAVIAVDPSSPLSGGATLGDRIRMLQHQDDPGVFIRSTASRGRSGGLAPTTAELVHLFDAAGFDVVIVETVGIGQEEIEIVGLVDTVVLVQVPGLGDSVQALKAGVLEVADIFVVNKADLPGANATARELRGLLTLAPGAKGWNPPVIPVTATEGSGISETLEAVNGHRDWLRKSGQQSERRRCLARREVGRHVQQLLMERLKPDPLTGESSEIIADVAERRRSPRRAAESIVDAVSRAS